MKRALVVAVVFFSITAVSTGRAAAATLEKGVKVGMSMSNWRGSGSGISDHKIGIAAGGFATYLVRENFGLQIEALYVTKGSVQKTNALDSGSVNLEYIEIPLLLRAVIPINKEKADKPRYHDTEAGLRPGFYIGPTVAISMTDEIEVDTTSVPIKKTDFGLAFGGGFDVEVGKGMVAFDARYTLGISKIFDSNDADVRNGTLTLMLGYVFR